MSAGLISVLAMVFVSASLFIGMIKNDVANKIISFIPTDAMMKILKSIFENTISFLNTAIPSLIILVWMVICIIVFIISYKKIGIDN